MADLRDIIPGLGDAVAQERLIRDSCFLVETETVGDFEFRPMTLADYIALRQAKSSLLRNAMPTPQQLVDFIWRMSPDFKPGDNAARARIQAACSKFVPPRKPWLHTRAAMARWEKACKRCLDDALKIFAAIKAYVAETFMDAPASEVKGYAPEYFGDGASIIGRLAREYGWTPDVIMALPLKQIFQFLREITQYHLGSKACFINALSDGVKRDWMNQNGGKKK